jgi:hypothetical protein
LVENLSAPGSMLLWCVLVCGVLSGAIVRLALIRNFSHQRLFG